jgi:TonB family protein
MSKLDQLLGSSVSDRPVFPSFDEPKTTLPPESSLLRDIAAGKYDVLFERSPDKASDVYRIAKLPIPDPEIFITLSPQLPAETLLPPQYPPIGRLAKIDGIVHVKFRIAKDGSTESVTVEDGHPMLRPATEQAVSAWRFPKEAANRDVQAAISFKSNCSAPK